MQYEPPFEVPKVPGVYMAITSELFQQPLDVPHRVVAIGQRTSAGTVPALEPTLIRTPLEADSCWGAGSMLAEMCRAHLANSDTELYAVAVDDAPGSTPATAGLTFAGEALSSGTLAVLVGGRRVRLGIPKGSTPENAAADLDQAMADDPRLACLHEPAGAAVNLTCKWAGETGNDLVLKVLAAPEGLDVQVTPFSSGATDPEVDVALTTLGDLHVHSLASGYADELNLGHYDAFFEARFGPTDQRDGLLFAVSRGGFGELLTLASALNSKFEIVGGPGSTPTPPWIVAAATASVDSAITRRQPNEGRDGHVLKEVLPPPVGERFDHEQRNTLLKNGISTYGVTASGHVVLERLVTTMTLNADGFPDEAYADIVTMRVLAAMRYDLRRRGSSWKGWLVAKDESMARQPKVVTPKRFEAIALTPAYMEWQRASWVQDMATFKRLLKVVVSESQDGFGVFLPTTIVRPLRVVAGEFAFM
jgi:phage tail sheath gpL-like